MINNILGILIQVTCAFIFLTIFYFTYAVKVEKKIVENNVKFLTKNFTGINLNLLNFKDIILNKINSIDSNGPEIKQQNTDIDNLNALVISKAKNKLIIVSSVVSVIVVVCLFLSKMGISFFKGINLKNIFKETAIILLFVAITEFIFLACFSSKWISVDPNVIKAHLFKNLANGFAN